MLSTLWWVFFYSEKILLKVKTTTWSWLRGLDAVRTIINTKNTNLSKTNQKQKQLLDQGNSYVTTQCTRVDLFYYLFRLLRKSDCYNQPYPLFVFSYFIYCIMYYSVNLYWSKNNHAYFKASTHIVRWMKDDHRSRNVETSLAVPLKRRLTSRCEKGPTCPKFRTPLTAANNVRCWRCILMFVITCDRLWIR